MLLRPLFALTVVAAVAACNPGDCQGAGFITDQPVLQVVDVPTVVGLCQGNNVTVIDDVNIKTAAQLATLDKCEHVTGNVIIHDSVDITDLAPLAALKTIDQGYFLALNNAALTTIELPKAEKIDYGIGVINNAALTAATFPNIVEAFGDITIRENPVLTNIAFDKIEKISNDARFTAAAPNAANTGNLIFGNNPKFTGFQSFANLDTIEGFVSVFNCDAITSFDGLQNLTIIKNDGNAAQALAIGIDLDDEKNIIAAGNDHLQNLQGLNDLDTVNGDIFIGFNPALENFQGLDDLTLFQKNLFIVQNDNLQDLSGVEGDGNNDGVNDGLQTVKGSIFIGEFFDNFKQPVAAGNAQLQDLTGLNHLRELDGSLVLAFNNQLNDLNGLTELPLIGKDFVLVGSDINNFDGADALTTIGGSLVIGEIFGNNDQVLNPVLDVDGQAFDTGVTVQNLDLAGVNTDFGALTTVTKDVVIAFSNLDNLRLADTLTTIGGRLILHDTNLANLAGMENLNTLGGLSIGIAIDKVGNFSAGGNNDFNSFAGLGVTALGAGGLEIGFNNALNNLNTLSILTGAIAGDVTIASENFTNLQGLNVVNIGGDLNIGAIRNGNAPPLDFGLDQLTALQLDNVTAIGGDVLIAFNDNLTDVGFTVLGDVNGRFEITNDTGLANINGLGAFATAGDLSIHDLPNLQQLTIQNLNTIDRNGLITLNPKLDTMNLNALTNVGGTFELSFVDNLQNLNSLQGLRHVGSLVAHAGDLVIADNQDLADITGINGLIDVGGDLFLVRNPSVDVLALNALTQVGGSFEVAEMAGLADLTVDGTNSLSLGSVGDALRVRDDANLITLKGLEGLGSIGLALSIVNNPRLQTVLIDSGQGDVIDLGDEGLVLLTNIGNANPLVDGVQGDRGVIEVQNNPQLDEQQLQDVINDLDGFVGDQGCDTANDQQCGLTFCGNQTQLGGNVDPFFDAVDCGVAAAASAGEGEGEGE